MNGLKGGILAAACVAVLGGPAWAQENLDAGKTPAQLYAADCAICHKTPQGMTKAGGIFGLSSFLRQHYTASREAAAAIAKYVQSVDKGPPPPAKRPPAKRTAKGNEKSKAGEAKRDESKAREEKPGSKPEAESTPEAPPKTEQKTSSDKAGDAKPAEPKAAESSKPATPKTDENPAAKDASDKKSD